MNAKHTPGPWSTRESLGATTVVGGKVYEFANGCGQHQVAMVCVVDEDNGDQGANARLIAAAPELLAALSAMFAHFDEAARIDDVRAYAVLEMARAAIAKARGAP